MHARSTTLTVDAHGIYARTTGRWEASWSPEDGAVWETPKASGGWLTKAYERGRGWSIVEDDAAAA